MSVTYTITLNDSEKEPVTFDRVVLRGTSGKSFISIDQLIELLNIGAIGENSMVCFERDIRGTTYETCIPVANIEYANNRSITK